MKIDNMKEEFFEWLNECPTNWFLIKQDGESVDYTFIKETENGCDICGLNPNYTQSKKQQQDESDFIKENSMCSACLND